jgi:hypothetical protein
MCGDIEAINFARTDSSNGTAPVYLDRPAAHAITSDISCLPATLRGENEETPLTLGVSSDKRAAQGGIRVRARLPSRQRLSHSHRMDRLRAETCYAARPLCPHL